MRLIVVFALLAVTLLFVAGCESQADDSYNYDYVPVQGNGCGVAGPGQVAYDAQEISVVSADEFSA